MSFSLFPRFIFASADNRKSPQSDALSECKQISRKSEDGSEENLTSVDLLFVYVACLVTGLVEVPSYICLSQLFQH